MNCDEFRTNLLQCTERRQGASTAIQHHAESCHSDECRQLWREQVLLDEAITAWKRAVPRVQLQNAVLQHVRTQRTSLRSKSGQGDRSRLSPAKASGWLAMGSLTAAAALILAVLHLPVQRDRIIAQHASKDAAMGPLGGPGGGSPARSSADSNPSPDEVLREVGSKWAGLMEGATTRITDTVTYVINPTDLRMDPMPGMGTTSGWLKTWSERLEPIEDSLDRTLRQLFDQSAGPTGEHAT